MQKYQVRTKCPTKGNPWYTGTAYGGYSNCITSGKNFVPRWYGSTMNNCVSTWGRYWEAQAINGEIFGRDTPEEIRKVFAWRPIADSPADMWVKMKSHSTWKNYQKPTPKQGALAFYKRVGGKGYAGHMCQVEVVHSNSCVDFYNNNYSTTPRFSYQKKKNPNGSFGVNFKLLGYLWPLADFEGTTYTTTDELHCRVKPGGEVIGTFKENTLVTIAGDHIDYQGKPWKKVKGKDNKGRTITGYVSMQYLK